MAKRGEWPRGPWDDEWDFDKKLSPGGQGYTYLVNAKDGGSTGVLKVLKEQKNLKRRARMRREASILQTLEHDRIPRLLKTNAGEFKKKDAKLYLVTEHIDGPTLGKARRPTLDEAFELTKSLCETLVYAHGEEVWHRDIKPSNIILRGGNFSDPVLIDFGISFNAAVPDDNVTAPWEQLGNRFLWLPELADGGQRDHRSDVTQLVGVLFFAVTCENPIALLDLNGRFPHRRPKAKQVLEQIEPTRLQVLNRVFDTGFQWRIDRRWQSVQALRSALEPRDQAIEDPVDVADLNEQISAELAARDPLYSDQATFRSARDAVMLAIYGVVHDLIRELDGFEPTKSPGPLDLSSLSYRYGAGLRPVLAPDMVFEATFVARVTGNEIVISREDGDHETELSRVPVESKPDLSDLKAKLIPFYRAGIHRRVMST